MKITSEKTETTFNLKLTEKEMIAITALIGFKTSGQGFGTIYSAMKNELIKVNLYNLLKEKESNSSFKDTDALAIL